MPRLERVPRPIFSWVSDASLIGIFLPLFLIWQLQDHLGKRRFTRVKWKLNKDHDGAYCTNVILSHSLDSDNSNKRSSLLCLAIMTVRHLKIQFYYFYPLEHCVRVSVILKQPGLQNE
jgi:hypothetical protein